MRFLIAALVVVLEFVLVSLIVPKSLMDWSSAVEIEWITKFYGADLAKSLTDRTNQWFRDLFLDSGAVQYSYFFVLPWGGETNDPFVYVEDKLGLIAFAKNRIDVFWMEIQQDILRFCQVGLWLIALAGFWLFWVLDGLGIRGIKRSTFGYQSPFLHSYALYVTGWIWAGLLFIILLPLPVPPWTYPLAVLLQGPCLNVIAANLPKKL